MMPDSILEQFDRAAKDFMFPMLDNGYVYRRMYAFLFSAISNDGCI
jgi:hypothetical protein